MGDMLVGVVLSAGPWDCGRMVGEGSGERRPVLDCGRDWEPSEPRLGDCWGRGVWGSRPGGRGVVRGPSEPGQEGRIEAVKEAEKETGVVGRLTFIGEEE